MVRVVFTTLFNDLIDLWCQNLETVTRITVAAEKTMGMDLIDPSTGITIVIEIGIGGENMTAIETGIETRVGLRTVRGSMTAINRVEAGGMKRNLTGVAGIETEEGILLVTGEIKIGIGRMIGNIGRGNGMREGDDIRYAIQSVGDTFSMYNTIS